MKNYIYNLTEETTHLLQFMVASQFKGDITVGEHNKEIFADNEISADIQNSVRGSRVFLLSSPKSSDDIMTLLLTMDAVRRSGAKEIIPVLPYFPYARADKRDNTRGPIGGKLVASMIERAGATSVIAFELHAGQIEGFFDIPLINIEGKDFFYPLFREFNNNDNVLLCAPDAGAGKRVEHLLDNVNKHCDLDLEYVMIHKTREKANVVGKMMLLGDVTGKDVVIYDDMGDTCGTIVKAASVIMQNGANSVSALLTHALFSGDAINKLNDSMLKRVFVSDSLGYKSTEKIITFSCGELISAAMYSIIDDESSYEDFLNEKINEKVKI